LIGVDAMTILNWEKGHSNPRLPAMPKIIEFLGYNPLPAGQTFGERLRLHRIEVGLTQQQLAQKLGINPSTLAHWEQGRHKPMRRLFKSIMAFLEDLRYGKEVVAGASQ